MVSSSFLHTLGGVLITVLSETLPLERRVAISPAAAGKLVAAGHTVSVESGAGTAAGYLDADYAGVGAEIIEPGSAASRPGVVVGVNRPDGAFTADHTVIALLDPVWQADATAKLAAGGATLISLEMIPRITRAQTMDVLSSMATVSGTEAVLLAAHKLPKLFPLMMTAAGTVPAAHVFVLGAGVAGLQAIATAKRLGAIVSAYDVRPAAAEQIRSLGARSIELDLDTDDAEDDGGYARALDHDHEAREQAMLAAHIAEADVVITTAAIPGAASPRLVSKEMVESMRPGSVIVDMAAERGGNCEVTEADHEVHHGGVCVLGPTDLASGAAQSASEMFGTNLVNLIRHLAPDGELTIDLDDEITGEIVVATGGQVRHPRVLEACS